MGPKSAVIALPAVVPWLAWAQPSINFEKLQPAISKLRTCVRSNAPAAQIAGIQTTNEAVVFLIERCDDVILSDLAGLGSVAVPPGLFRFVVRDEWTAFRAEE
jgi:hypothetical protein